MKKRAYLYRDEITGNYIRSVLFIEGQTFHIIERAWLNNKRNISCIPAGVYQVQFMARSGSGKYRNVFWLRNVPGRSGVLVHNGNLAAHSRGCLIIGMRRGTLAGQPAVLNSKTALRALGRIAGRQSFELHIIGDQVCQQLAG